MKTLFLIFHGRFPSEKAASLFAAKSCAAFAEEGLQVILLAPRRIGRFSENAREFYGVKNSFKIIFLPTIDLFPLKIFERFAFRLSLISFSVFCFMYLFCKADKKDIIYSNETLPLLLTSHFFKNTLYELHDFPEKKFSFYKKLFSGLRWILVTNKLKIEKLKDIFNIENKKLIYEPNAVEIGEFDIDISKEKARDILNLPKDKKIIIYTGHLYPWKGVDTLIEASNFLDDNFVIYLVGGTEKDIESYKEKIKGKNRIVSAGHKKHKEIPLWQKSADVLVLPNTAKEYISKYYTSPMKLFEYMASKRPIVASDIPSVAEILNDKNAIMFEPDNPRDLSEKIKWIFDNQEKAKILSEQAFKDVQRYSWRKRAKRIISNF